MITAGVVDAVTAVTPPHGPEGLAGDAPRTGTVAGTGIAGIGATGGATDTGALGETTAGAGAFAALPTLPMVATKPALSTDESEVNEIVSIVPLDRNIGGTLVPEYDAPTAPVADPPLYSFTKS